MSLKRLLPSNRTDTFPTSNDKLEEVIALAVDEYNEKDFKANFFCQLLDLIDGFVIVKNLDNEIMFCNDYTARMIGLSKDEICGSHYSSIWPDDRYHSWQNDMDVAITGKPKIGIVEKIELKPGVSRWFKTSKVPVRTEDGDLCGLLLVSIDINDQMRADKDANTTGE